MKIALCYSGNFRTFNECSDVNYNFFKELSNDIDVFFSTWSEIKYALLLNDHKHFFCKNRIEDTELVTNELIEKFIPKGCNIKAIEIQNYKDIEFSEYTPKEQGLLYQYYKIKKCFELLKKEDKYDIVVRIRPDIIVNAKFDKNYVKNIIEQNRIIFEKFVWGNYSFSGRDINEMIWISNYELMEKCVKIYDNFMGIKKLIPNDFYGERICYTNLQMEQIQDKLEIYDFNYNVIR